MTAYSYTDWNMLPPEKQQNFPGISIPREHPINNVNRGVYWSGTTAARALSKHLETTLAGPDRDAARHMWNELKILRRKAVESNRLVDRALNTRRLDSNRALDAYNGDLDDTQLTKYSEVAIAVASVHDEAIRQEKNPQVVIGRLLDRAASKAVGFDMSSSENDPELSGIYGSKAEQDLDAAVIGLHNANEAKYIGEDAMDYIATIGVTADYTDDVKESHRRLSDMLQSIPRALDPSPIDQERNFSVRMDSAEEANVVETVLRWVGDKKQLPEPAEIHQAFNAWRDSGMSPSPYGEEASQSVGLIVGQGEAAAKNLGVLMAEIAGEKDANIFGGRDMLVMTIDADEKTKAMVAQSGRPVINMTATADENGIKLVGDRSVNEPAIKLLNLTADQAADPIARSLAANALVAYSEQVTHLAGHGISSLEKAMKMAGEMDAVSGPTVDSKGNEVAYTHGEIKALDPLTMTRLHPAEAQAIHIAGTSRKLAMSLDVDGTPIGPESLRELRAAARETDKAADPQRYFTGGISRPTGGVLGVAFDGARNFDKANARFAPGRDLIAEAYEQIPNRATILAVDTGNDREGRPLGATNRWLEDNARNRNVLYADAKRTLSFANLIGVGIEGERHTARIAETELKIYDRPAPARSYRHEAPDGTTRPATYEEFLKSRGKEGEDRSRVVCTTPEIDWNDPKIAGAIIKVSGQAYDNAINGNAQALKVAQEAVMDRAHTAIIMNDNFEKGTDFHAAHMIRLAYEMDKKATVLAGNGREVPLAEARELTRVHGANMEETRRFDFERRLQKGDYALSSDVAQLALSALPGMNAEKAAKLANVDMTIRELVNDKSEETRRSLMDLGVPSEARAVMNNVGAWEKALDRAVSNVKEIDAIGGTLYQPGEKLHPLAMANSHREGYMPKTPVVEVTTNPDAFNYEALPLAAFIGGSDMYREPGVKGLIDPANTVERESIRNTIEGMTKAGYGIVVALESGVSRAVLEEAVNVPDAKVVLASGGNPKNAPSVVQEAMYKLLDEGRVSLIMPEHIAPINPANPSDKETYFENKSAMRQIMADISSVGVVVASGPNDQALHTVRHMIDQDKPIAAIIPQNADMASSEIYQTNLKLVSGKGRATIFSERLAEATNARGYANIQDTETAVHLEDGVLRGNAGTFQSERLSQQNQGRAGRHGLTFGWEEPARPLSSQASVMRFAADAEQGMVAGLGQYREISEREKEKLRHDRSAVNSEVLEEFSTLSRVHSLEVPDSTLQNNLNARAAAMAAVRQMG